MNYYLFIGSTVDGPFQSIDPDAKNLLFSKVDVWEKVAPNQYRTYTGDIFLIPDCFMRIM